jgi:hypothetical protein
MTTQSAFLGLLIATLCGLIFHLIRGGSLGRLGLYVLTAWVAFFTGHLLGNALHWTALRIGPLNLLPALLGTVAGLLAASILAGRNRESPLERDRHRPPRRQGR